MNIPETFKMQSALAVIRSRLASKLGLTHAGQRDTWSVFGWPQDIKIEDLYGMYLRGGVANRIVKAYPKSTWKDTPTIRDSVGSSAEKERADGTANPNYSPFVEALENFFKEKRLYRTLMRADRLASIGTYGLIVLGFQDGKQPHEPLEKGRAPLLFTQPYSENNITVSSWDSDRSSPRYGLPTIYTVQPNRSAIGQTTQSYSMPVHYSRVIHLAETLDDNEVYGVPILLPIYNLLLDLAKVTGSGAEAFWLNARPGLSLTADSEAELTESALSDMKEQAEEWEHQLRRVLALQGVSAEQLGTNQADPKNAAEVILDQIGGTIGIPKRLLTGSERGELASSMDEHNWAQQIDERRETYASPMMIDPLVERLIFTGNLPEPKDSRWWTVWPSSTTLSPEKRAEAARDKTESLRAYSSNPNAQIVVPIAEFREVILELSPTSEYEDEESEDFEEVDEEDPDVRDQFVTSNLAENVTRTAYVRRYVQNADEIVEWARGAGLETEEPEDLHVTLVYSLSRFDWGEVSGPHEAQLEVPAGGPRMTGLLGRVADNLVLFFQSDELSSRHWELRRAGAQHDWPLYRPHITVAKGVGEMPSGLGVFEGAILLGPEVWSERS